MKIVEQARLWFREGNSDKVYEIDLVEVAAGQHVVNFRYGRRGSTLRDGTKTPTPVALEKARTIFEALVAEKTKGGYQAIGAVPSTPTATRVARTTASRDDEYLIRALGLGHRGAKPLHVTVRKVGDLGLQQAEPLLLELLKSAPPPPNMKPDVWQHILVCALARCGSSVSVPKLTTIANDNKARPHLREVARIALSIIAPRAIDAAALLPPSLRALLGDPAQLAPAAERLFANDAFAAREAVMALELLGERATVLAIARVTPLRPRGLAILRALNRAAELRRDGELFAILARRFETRHRPGMARQSSFLYLRRRVARHLRRMASVESPDFTRMATELLLTYRDSDAEPVRESQSGRWDRFAWYHALDTVLYHASSRYEPASPTKMTWRCKPGRRPGESLPSVREEGWPELWDRAPELLWRLGTSESATPVIEFATRALSQQRAYLTSRSNDDLATGMSAPHVLMRRLAFGEARTRTPDVTLVRGALRARLDEADAWVLDWVNADKAAAAKNAELLALLLVAPGVFVRNAAIALLRTHPLDASLARDVLTLAIAHLMSVRDEAEARAATDTILQALPLDGLGEAIVRDLLAHPLPGVAALGGEILVRMSRAGSIPTGLLDALLDSPHGHLRAIGARIVSETPPELLKDDPALLAHLALSESPELREGTRALLGAVAAAYEATGRAVAGLLIDALLGKLPEGAPAHVVSLLRRELRDRLPARDPKNILALLGALSPHAREAGGLLVSQLDADTLELEDIIRMASNDILSVRQGAWALATTAKARFRMAPIALSRLCDSKWEDSRRAAFEIARSLELSADGIIAICDSPRADVQAFGQSLLRESFTEDRAERYLLRLSEHPSTSIQLLVSELLEHHARGRLDRIAALEPYLRTVLSQPNRGGVAKQRVLAFLRTEAIASVEAATLLAPLLERQSATNAVTHRAPLIATMVAVHTQHPDVPLPITIVPPQGGDRGV